MDGEVLKTSYLQLSCWIFLKVERKRISKLLSLQSARVCPALCHVAEGLGFRELHKTGCDKATLEKTEGERGKITLGSELVLMSFYLKAISRGSEGCTVQRTRRRVNPAIPLPSARWMCSSLRT